MGAAGAALSDAPLVKLCGGTHLARTETLIGHAVSLLKAGVDPARILLTAPSAFAAEALAERLHAAAGNERASDIATVSALTLCSSVVETAREKGLTERFGRILPQEEYLFLLEDLKTLGQKNQRLHGMLSFFRAQWSDMAPEGEWVIAGEESTVIALLRKLLACYEGGLRDEVPALAAELLTENGRETLGADFDYVICDDFQNISHAEQTALSLCCGKQLLVAGDEAATVKGATGYPYPRGFADFERVRRNATVLDLGDEGAKRRTVEHVVWERPEQELGALVAAVRTKATSDPATHRVLVAVPTRFWGRQVVRALEAAGIRADDAGLGTSLGGDPRTPGCHSNLTAYAKLLLAAEPESALAWRIWSGLDHALTRSDLWLEVRRRAERDGSGDYEAFAAMADEAVSGADVPFTKDLVALRRSGEDLISRTRDLTGSALLEALGIESDSRIGVLAGPVGDDESPAEILDLVRSRLTEPRFSDADAAVRIGLYENVAGLEASCTFLPGLVDGLIPHRDAFDIVKDPERRTLLLEEETARLKAAAETSDVRFASSFIQAGIELAERAKMRVERIASQDGKRTARLGVSCVADTIGIRSDADAAESEGHAAICVQ